MNGLRTVDDLRNDLVRDDWSRDTWQRMLALAEAEVKRGPVLITDELPGRPPSMVASRNPDYVVCHEAGQLLLRASLAHLLTGRAEFKAAALAQLAALYDPAVWPDWIDQGHTHFSFKADLRTGMLSQAVAGAYDWLAPTLSAEERRWVIEGLDRRGIQPYLESIEMNAWWVHHLNNWLTCIVGGLGIAGMALDGEHPDARRLIDFAVEKLEGYLSIYGPEGEFNESVGYAGANRLPVEFFVAHRYWLGGKQTRLARTPFPEMCRWIMQTTLPPGRVVSVGDCWPEHPVRTGYVAAVAAANQDGILQWFYQQYQQRSAEPYQLLIYDGRVPPVSPEGQVPLFKAYHAQGKLVISRTDWGTATTACVVHSKAGREESHEHNDVGQLCLDGYGERLIIDLGSPSGYPEDFFEAVRWRYYNASIRGHNVLMFDGEEQRSPNFKRGEALDTTAWSGSIVSENFRPEVGTAWKMDLSLAYLPGQKVTRTVVHLYPGYVAVLDEAELASEQAISLRWHTCDRAEPDAEGNFVVRGRQGKVTAVIARLDEGAMTLGRGEHHYEAPFDRDRTGTPLEQRRESYVEATLHGNRCRILTLFCVEPAAAAATLWTRVDGTWTHGEVVAQLTAERVELANGDQTIGWG